MKTFFGFLAGAILIICMFSMIKHIDFIFLNTLYANGHSVTEIDSVKSFQGYSDFVTVITGILALIIGSTGFAAIFSYKKITDLAGEIDKIKDEAVKQLAEKREDIDKFKNEARRQLESKLAEIDEVKNEADELRDKLASYATIQQASSLLSSEEGKSSAIDVFNSAGSGFDVNALYYLLKGDAYYYRGKNGDYDIAVEHYNKAIESDNDLGTAWFGLGRAKYRSVYQLPENDTGGMKKLPIEKVACFRLPNNKNKPKDSAIDIVHEAISDIRKSVSYGYSKAEAGFEMGHMYKYLGEYDNALREFKKVFDINKNYTVCGYYYCQLWVLKYQDTFGENALDKKVVDEVVGILKSVGFKDVNLSKAAYALLWYLYSTAPMIETSKSDAEDALKSTDQYTINDLFKGSEGC